MNIDLLKHHAHQQTGRYLDMLFSHDLLPVITKPTRITSHTATLIDHIYTNTVNSLVSGILTIDISDHLPVFCMTDIKVKKQKQKMYFRDYSTFNADSFLQDVYAIDWNDITIQCTDLHEITALTIDTLKSIVNKHAPKKQTSRNKQRLLQKPWISKGILKSIKIKHTMYKTHFLSRDPSKVCEFKKYSNRSNYLKNISKKTYFCKRFDLCKGNLKATWKLIGTLIKRKTKAQSTPLRIVRNNKAYTNNADIADQFNKHFINVGPLLASKIENSNENPLQYITSSPASSFVMFPVTEPEVSTLFKNLDANKSSIDIPNKLIKLAADPLSVLFTQIYNQSIETGIVPNVMKVSRVTPVYKNGDVTNTGNYRPISTLSPFSKVFEGLIYNQLNNFLEKNNILYQYHYGVRGTPFNWFKSYLHNRTQFVEIGNTKSSYETIVCGIPQGSTLGPLLFLLYINDLPNCSKKLSFPIFADDTNMFYTCDKLQHLETIMNEELKLVFKYCDINNLSINLAKTNYMVIIISKIKWKYMYT